MCYLADTDVEKTIKKTTQAFFPVKLVLKLKKKKKTSIHWFLSALPVV